MSAPNLAAIADDAERRQRFAIGDVAAVPAQPTAEERLSWSPPPSCMAQRQPLEECGHVADVTLTIAIERAGELVTERELVVCQTHRHVGETVLLAHVPRNRVVTLTARPIETVKGLN